MAKGVLGGLKGLDAFGKTMEDVKVKTRTGAFLTLLSAAIIFAITTMEFFDYRRVHMDTSIAVDKSRGEKLVVKMNVTFPRVPCYLLSVDFMDISGETQTDIVPNIIKTRLDERGVPLPQSKITQLRNDVDKLNEQRQAGYCGSCYGGIEPPNGCCNSCEDVRQAYVNRGWSFNSPDAIEQCVQEGWSEKLKEQANEGCNVAGLVRVNKVVGNIHLSPGRSFRTGSQTIYELVPYLKDDGNRHDFTHTIHEFGFAGENEYHFANNAVSRRLKERLGIEGNPLDDTTQKTMKQQYMFQYFLKVVSTQFKTIEGRDVKTHQYSATHFERDLSKGIAENNPAGQYVMHGMTGVPGVFFNFEISPILVIHQEIRQSFAHFLTSTCAVVGGVLTVASLIDSVLFATTRKLKKSGNGGVALAGGYTNGKLM